MANDFSPFTPDAFKKQTGLNAHEHEGVYLRWVNVNINYQNYISLRDINQNLQVLISTVRAGGGEPLKDPLPVRASGSHSGER